MNVVTQTDDLRLFHEALRSRCSGVRLGSEFCEQLLPSQRELAEAVELAQKAGKPFTYVTPRLSNAGIDRLKGHLAFLNEKQETHIVFNDLGTLNILGCHSNLHPHLGRHMLLVPSRSPWVGQHLQREDLSARRRRWLRSLFSSTSLNYRPTIETYRGYGCERADMGWLPRTFSSLAFLVENGLRLSVHLHLVPATFTRKCHTARFLGEADPEECSKPCLHRPFLLRNEPFGMEFILHGNAVFQLVEPHPRDVKALEEAGVAELVLTMNLVTGIDSAEKIDDTISDLGL